MRQPHRRSKQASGSRRQRGRGLGLWLGLAPNPRLGLPAPVGLGGDPDSANRSLGGHRHVPLPLSVSKTGQRGPHPATGPIRHQTRQNAHVLTGPRVPVCSVTTATTQQRGASTGLQPMPATSPPARAGRPATGRCAKERPLRAHSHTPGTSGNFLGSSEAYFQRGLSPHT